MSNKSIDKELESKFLDSTDLRLKSIKDGILRTGPEVIRIGISRSCNFDCLTCWHYSPLLKNPKPKEWKKIKIEKDLVFNILDELAKMQCIGVLFSGTGEPFTHPNMMDFIRKAKENKMIVRIQTNLSLVKNVNELTDYLRSRADLVCVNLSAATAKTYNRIHPSREKKRFYQIIEKIQILRRKNVLVRLVYVVNKLNYREIPSAFQLNNDLGTRLHLEVLDFHPGAGIEKLALNGIEKKEIVRELSKLKKQREYRIKSNLDDFINQIIHSALGWEKINSCSVGYFYSIIDESANVFYCYNMDKTFLMGNLNNQSFKDIWLSQNYQKLRNICLRGKFLKTCKKCVKERGMNFKVRMYIKPEIRNFELEKMLVRTINKL